MGRENSKHKGKKAVAKLLHDCFTGLLTLSTLTEGTQSSASQLHGS